MKLTNIVKSLRSQRTPRHAVLLMVFLVLGGGCSNSPHDSAQITNESQDAIDFEKYLAEELDEQRQRIEQRVAETAKRFGAIVWDSSLYDERLTLPTYKVQLAIEQVDGQLLAARVWIEDAVLQDDKEAVLLGRLENDLDTCVRLRCDRYELRKLVASPFEDYLIIFKPSAVRSHVNVEAFSDREDEGAYIDSYRGATILGSCLYLEGLDT